LKVECEVEEVKGEFIGRFERTFKAEYSLFEIGLIKK